MISAGPEVKVWDVPAGKERFTLGSPPVRVDAAAISSDGTVLATLAEDGPVMLWDAATGKERTPNRRDLAPSIGRERLAGAKPKDQSPKNKFARLAFSPDGRYLASLKTSDLRGVVLTLWDVGAGTLLATSTVWDEFEYFETPGGNQGFAFSPDGKILAAALGNRIQLWNTESTPTIDDFAALGAFPDDVDTMPEQARSAAERRFAGRSLLTRAISGGSGAFFTLAFSPDGQFLVTGGMDNLIRMWRWPAKDSFRADLHGLFAEDRLPKFVDNFDLLADEGITGIAFAADSHRIVSTSCTGTTRTWEVDAEVDAVHAGSQLRSDCLSSALFLFSPDGTKLAGIGEFHKPFVLDQHGEMVELSSHPGYYYGPRCLAFSSDGTMLAGGFQETLNLPWLGLHFLEPLVVWNTEKPERTKRGSLDTPDQIWNNDGQKVTSMAFNPDGDVLASGTTEGRVYLWRRDSANWGVRKQVRYIGRPETKGEVTGLGFSADGGVLASGTDDGQIEIWDWRSSSRLAAIPASGTSIHALCFAPRGKILAAGQDDGSILFWDTERPPQQATRAIGHARKVTALAFSRDSDILASGGADGIVRLWDPNRGEQLASFPSRLAEIKTLAFRHEKDRWTLVALSGDGMISLWQAAIEDEVRKPTTRSLTNKEHPDRGSR